MASSDFANRFKHKIEKIGKSGLDSLKANFPIEKTEVPKSKIHKSMLTLVESKPRLVLVSKGIEDFSSSLKKTSRCKTNLKFLPKLRVSPSKVIAQSHREGQERILGLGLNDRSKISRSYCNSLPKISQRLIDVKNVLAKSRKVIESMRESD